MTTLTTLTAPPVPGSPAATVRDAMTDPEFQIADDTAVDRVGEILRGAHVPYLVLRDHDGRCSGVVTRAQLAPFLAVARSARTVPVREVAHDIGPYAWPELGIGLAAVAMEVRSLQVWPVVDDDGYLLGVLTPDGLRRGPYPR
ncbi:CBS domain-containing protein [Kitasatospora sp. NPDC048540]|uniref:CBS domain-containing protein n=1 Tax=unclassified Kitasatospora TaxID=2633591 RepID=UPI00053A0187|nr:CBS domain-containing protein [Kitasatospora sp. MBT63]